MANNWSLTACCRIEASSRLLLLLLIILQLTALTPAMRNAYTNSNNNNNNNNNINNNNNNHNNNNNNIWRRVRLVTSVSSERNAYQLLKSNSTSTTSTTTSTTSTTSTSTTTTTPAPSRRSPKQLLLRREDLNVLDSSNNNNNQNNISSAARLEMSTEFFVVPTLTHRHTTNNSTTATLAPTRSSGARARANTPRATASGSATPPSIVSTTHLPFAGLRKEVWVVPVLVLASLTMLMMGAFEIFVLFKAWRTSPSRRHLFLGQMLLLGLFACAGLGAVITAQPTLLSCGAIRFGVGVAYAMVFAALLVKCVFLISLNGGVYLPAPYQGLLLLFALLIQVAIGAQWLLTQPPEIYTTSVPVLGSGFLSTTVASQTNYSALFYPTSYTTLDGTPEIYTRIAAVSTVLIPLCKTQFSELLFSLIYIVFLIVFIAVLAIKSRGIRDNYREATYIGLAIGGAIPIWLGWMLCGLAVAERHKDACIAFGLVATSATVFLVMFMPKGRQLAAMGKEGLYVEDREEQFSSLSRAGSGYSPSFFHFKPIKYGVMSGCGLPNSATNTGQGLSSKHCSSANNGGGMFIRPDETNLYTTLEPTMSSNPNVYFQRSGAVHPGILY